MTLRRVTAGLLIFLFVLVSLPTFLVFGIGNSVMRTSFYEGGVSAQAYDLLVKYTADKLLKADTVIAQYFNQSDLIADIKDVYPQSLFQNTVNDLVTQTAVLKDNPRQTLTVSMKEYRNALLSFANNLSYKLFKALPACKGGEIPAQDTRGLPTCVPAGAQYNLVAAPFTQQFEASVYSAVPDQVQFDLNTVTGQNGEAVAKFFQVYAKAKTALYATLLILLVLIALLAFNPFSLIAKYEGFAFLASGVAGLLLSVGLMAMPPYLISDFGIQSYKDEIRQMIQSVFDAVSSEAQKMAIVFLALGVVLILVRAFLVYRFNEEKEQ